MSFRTRLMLLCIFWPLCLAALITTLTYYANQRMLEAEIRGSFEYRAVQTMDTIDRMLFERYADVQAIATDAALVAQHPHIPAVLERLMTYRDIYKTYLSLQLFSPDPDQGRTFSSAIPVIV